MKRSRARLNFSQVYSVLQRHANATGEAGATNPEADEFGWLHPRAGRFLPVVKRYCFARMGTGSDGAGVVGVDLTRVR